MTNSLRKPAWAGDELRLDPGRFPQQVTYASRQDNNCVTFTLDHRGAVLRKVLPQSGLPLSIALPVRAFKGIAARAIDHGNGSITVTLELHHEDSELCVPLLVAHNLDDIAADWNSWSQVYKLPMLMIEADGTARPLEERLGQIKTKSTKPRRRHSSVADRRPRFLVRRSTGALGIRLTINGEEIIARR
ncbi:MAG: hypothetical protein GY789_11740 [Hyphomicrobiales bacterium]|nr:hypothetical protein [Hyphomicrobiales bacterium]MCP4999803.1 hypothetical protein [Hyphomicrobiales bacterium]